MRRTFFGMLIAAAVLAVGGCGGEDDSTAPAVTNDTSGTAADESTTTTEDEATTTTSIEPPRPQAPEADQQLAVAATFPAADFGDPWVELSPAETVDLTGGGCSDREGGPEERLGTGAVYQGPRMQLGESVNRVSSRAYVFETADDAAAWLAIVNSDEWGECVLAEFQAAEDEQETGIVVRLASRDPAGLGEAGFASYARYEFEDPDNVVVLSNDLNVFRIDRVVILASVETGPAVDGEAAPFEDAVNSALERAYERVNTMLATGPP